MFCPGSALAGAAAPADASNLEVRGLVEAGNGLFRGYFDRGIIQKPCPTILGAYYPYFPPKSLYRKPFCDLLRRP